MVSQWLSGLPSTPRAPTNPAPVPSRIVPAEPRHDQGMAQAPASVDGARIAVLEQRLAEAFAALQRLSDEARQREARLQSALAEERRVAALQIERLNSDVAGLRTAVAALSLRPLGAPAAAEGARPAAGLGFWQRREH